jgi:hypothetical protein
VKTVSEKPIQVEVMSTTTVVELKEIIKQRAKAEGKFLRLIHRVRFLFLS